MTPTPREVPAWPHRPSTFHTQGPFEICADCREPWPCPSQQYLDRERREQVDPDPRMTAVVKAATDLIEHGEWTAGQNAHWLQTMGEGKALYIALREAVEALDG